MALTKLVISLLSRGHLYHVALTKTKFDKKKSKMDGKEIQVTIHLYKSSTPYPKNNFYMQEIIKAQLNAVMPKTVR